MQRHRAVQVEIVRSRVSTGSAGAAVSISTSATWITFIGMRLIQPARRIVIRHYDADQRHRVPGAARICLESAPIQSLSMVGERAEVDVVDEIAVVQSLHRGVRAMHTGHHVLADEVHQRGHP